MRLKASPRTGAPLIELLAAIGIFALAAVLILQLFLGAHFTAQYSSDKNSAILKAQTAADSLSALGEEALPALGFLKQPQENGGICYLAYYDRDWSPAGEDGLFVATLTLSREERDGGTLFSGTISFTRSQPYPFLSEARTAVFSMPVAQYFPANE